MSPSAGNEDPKRGASHTLLQRDLVGRIIGLIHAEGLGIGDRLNESRLADRLNVSRTPVRAALDTLCEMGFVSREPNRGAVLRTLPPLPAVPDHEAAAVEDDSLLSAIARDWSRGQLAEQVSEAELMRAYGCSRQAVRRVLERLLDLGSVERRPGYGWSFVEAIRDGRENRASYRFRIVIETAAILEPDFALPPGWAAEMRARHAKALVEEWGEHSSVGFFEMNAEFHLGIAQASGNRHFSDAVARQNQLRRLSNYHWISGFSRVEVNCREHMAILDALEKGDNEIAAVLMRRHLEDAVDVP
ncbi:MAG: GntR family transcriptional regulator [Alphaproteobacteria bacterium]|jgi:DNA-binding GntR family transcriptional regulator|nr:GntR family transcriptional regulator [Alphaproteobacteria bacterium]